MAHNGGWRHRSVLPQGVGVWLLLVLTSCALCPAVSAWDWETLCNASTTSPDTDDRLQLVVVAPATEDITEYYAPDTEYDVLLKTKVALEGVAQALDASAGTWLVSNPANMPTAQAATLCPTRAAQGHVQAWINATHNATDSTTQARLRWRAPPLATGLIDNITFAALLNLQPTTALQTTSLRPMYTDARLDNLVVSNGGVLQPEFSPDTANYTLWLPHGERTVRLQSRPRTGAVASVTLSGIPLATAATNTWLITPPIGTAWLVISSSVESATAEYTIQIHRAPSDPIVREEVVTLTMAPINQTAMLRGSLLQRPLALRFTDAAACIASDFGTSDPAFVWKNNLLTHMAQLPLTLPSDTNNARLCLIYCDFPELDAMTGTCIAAGARVLATTFRTGVALASSNLPAGIVFPGPHTFLLTGSGFIEAASCGDLLLLCTTDAGEALPCHTTVVNATLAAVSLNVPSSSVPFNQLLLQLQSSCAVSNILWAANWSWPVTLEAAPMPQRWTQAQLAQGEATVWLTGNFARGADADLQASLVLLTNTSAYLIADDTDTTRQVMVTAMTATTARATLPSLSTDYAGPIWGALRWSNGAIGPAVFLGHLLRATLWQDLLTLHLPRASGTGADTTTPSVGLAWLGNLVEGGLRLTILPAQSLGLLGTRLEVALQTDTGTITRTIFLTTLPTSSIHINISMVRSICPAADNGGDGHGASGCGFDVALRANGQLVALSTAMTTVNVAALPKPLLAVAPLAPRGWLLVGATHLYGFGTQSIAELAPTWDGTPLICDSGNNTCPLPNASCFARVPDLAARLGLGAPPDLIRPHWQFIPTHSWDEAGSVRIDGLGGVERWDAMDAQANFMHPNAVVPSWYPRMHIPGRPVPIVSIVLRLTSARSPFATGCILQGAFFHDGLVVRLLGLSTTSTAASLLLSVDGELVGELAGDAANQYTVLWDTGLPTATCATQPCYLQVSDQAGAWSLNGVWAPAVGEDVTFYLDRVHGYNLSTSLVRLAVDDTDLPPSSRSQVPLHLLIGATLGRNASPTDPDSMRAQASDASSMTVAPALGYSRFAAEGLMIVARISSPSFLTSVTSWQAVLELVRPHDTAIISTPDTLMCANASLLSLVTRQTSFDAASADTVHTVKQTARFAWRAGTSAGERPVGFSCLVDGMNVTLPLRWRAAVQALEPEWARVTSFPDLSAGVVWNYAPVSNALFVEQYWPPASSEQGMSQSSLLLQCPDKLTQALVPIRAPSLPIMRLSAADLWGCQLCRGGSDAAECIPFLDEPVFVPINETTILDPSQLVVGRSVVTRSYEYPLPPLPTDAHWSAVAFGASQSAINVSLAVNVSTGHVVVVGVPPEGTDWHVDVDIAWAVRITMSSVRAGQRRVVQVSRPLCSPAPKLVHSSTWLQQADVRILAPPARTAPLATLAEWTVGFDLDPAMLAATTFCQPLSMAIAAQVTAGTDLSVSTEPTSTSGVWTVTLQNTANAQRWNMAEPATPFALQITNDQAPALNLTGHLVFGIYPGANTSVFSCATAPTRTQLAQATSCLLLASSRSTRCQQAVTTLDAAGCANAATLGNDVLAQCTTSELTTLNTSASAGPCTCSSGCGTLSDTLGVLETCPFLRHSVPEDAGVGTRYPLLTTLDAASVSTCTLTGYAAQTSPSSSGCDAFEDVVGSTLPWSVLGTDLLLSASLDYESTVAWALRVTCEDVALRESLTFPLLIEVQDVPLRVSAEAQGGLKLSSEEAGTNTTLVFFGADPAFLLTDNGESVDSAYETMCALDGATLRPCSEASSVSSRDAAVGTGQLVWSTLLDGWHQLLVTSLATGSGSVVANTVVSFCQQRTPPVVSLATMSEGSVQILELAFVNEGGPCFAAERIEAINVSCTLDAGTLAACASLGGVALASLSATLVLDSLQRGAHVFQLVVQDSTGRSLVYTHSWVVGTLEPRLTFRPWANGTFEVQAVPADAAVACEGGYCTALDAGRYLVTPTGGGNLRAWLTAAPAVALQLPAPSDDMNRGAVQWVARPSLHGYAFAFNASAPLRHTCASCVCRLEAWASPRASCCSSATARAGCNDCVTCHSAPWQECMAQPILDNVAAATSSWIPCALAVPLDELLASMEANAGGLSSNLVEANGARDTIIRVTVGYSPAKPLLNWSWSSLALVEGARIYSAATTTPNPDDTSSASSTECTQTGTGSIVALVVLWVLVAIVVVLMYLERARLKLGYRAPGIMRQLAAKQQSTRSLQVVARSAAEEADERRRRRSDPKLQLARELKFIARKPPKAPAVSVNDGEPVPLHGKPFEDDAPTSSMSVREWEDTGTLDYISDLVQPEWRPITPALVLGRDDDDDGDDVSLTGLELGLQTFGGDDGGGAAAAAVGAAADAVAAAAEEAAQAQDGAGALPHLSAAPRQDQEGAAASHAGTNVKREEVDFTSALLPSDHVLSLVDTLQAPTVVPRASIGVSTDAIRPEVGQESPGQPAGQAVAATDVLLLPEAADPLQMMELPMDADVPLDFSQILSSLAQHVGEGGENEVNELAMGNYGAPASLSVEPISNASPPPPPPPPPAVQAALSDGGGSASDETDDDMEML